MIKNLVLDIGNVICEWNPQKLTASVLDNKADQLAVLEATVKHSDWLALDKGTMALEDAILNAQARTNLDGESVAGVYHNLPSALAPIESTVNAMHRANEAGVSMYVLSNMHAHAWTHLKEQHACFGLCEGVVISSEVKLIKPDHDIYHYLTSTFSLKPEECVFVDDMQENIDAAKACGWEGRQLTDTRMGGELIDQLVEQILGSS